MSLGLVMALSVSRLGQGQAREAGTEKSDVSGISLSRAKKQCGLTRDGAQAGRRCPWTLNSVLLRDGASGPDQRACPTQRVVREPAPLSRPPPSRRA